MKRCGLYVRCSTDQQTVENQIRILTDVGEKAGWTIVRVFEDVGRHNALDKLFGWMVKSGIDPAGGLVFLTSRASYELVRKCARMNVPVLATISAPTTLAIRIAQAAGIRLLSFCRQNGFVEYPAMDVAPQY